MKQRVGLSPEVRLVRKGPSLACMETENWERSSLWGGHSTSQNSQLETDQELDFSSSYSVGRASFCSARWDWTNSLEVDADGEAWAMRTLTRANWWERRVCWRWNGVQEDGTPWLIPPIFVGYLLHTRCSDGAWYTTQKIMEWHLLALRNSRSSVGSRQQAHYCKLWKVFWRNKGDVMTAENRGIE